MIEGWEAEGGKEKLSLWEQVFERLMERVSGTYIGTDEKTRGASDDGYGGRR